VLRGREEGREGGREGKERCTEIRRKGEGEGGREGRDVP